MSRVGQHAEIMLPPALAALATPAAYSHAVTAVELIETHISWVILTGSFAYKIKRPVQYPFVDFRSLAQREYFCREELRLNRRFAPDVYLDVCTVVRRGATVTMGGEGEIVEYAVRMRQFDPLQELGTLVERDDVAVPELHDFGVRLAGLHANMTSMLHACESDRTRGVLLENARQCMAVTDADPERVIMRRVTVLLGKRLTACQEVLDARSREGRVRECHGDLHMSNVARIDGRLLAFDCLEFDPEFRHIDVAQEVAFLAMDLTVHGRADLASAFLNAWLATSGDYAAVELLDLFEAHCALVRAKVSGLNITRPATRHQSALRERQVKCIAHADARLATARPQLILMHGLSGSGKSWLAARLALAMPAIHLRSDIERKRLAGLAPQRSSSSLPGAGLYVPELTQATYARLVELAAAVLRGGRSALIDATFLERDKRALFASLAGKLGAPLKLLDCRAPDDVLRARLVARRSAGHDPSEADQDVVQWQRDHAEPIGHDEGIRVLNVDTTAAQAVDLAHRQLADRD